MVAQLDSRRLRYLDSLRGLAALAVVIYHYALDLSGQKMLHGTEATLVAVIGDILDLGKYGVVLFFLISGYIIPNSLGLKHDRIGRFGISRFFRLYPLYWLVLFAGVLLPWPDINRNFPASTIVANATMLQGYLGRPDIIGTAWTLQIELTFYGCCAVLAYVHLLASPRMCVSASIGFLAVAFILAVARNLLVLKLPLALPLALSLMFFGALWRQATLVREDQARRLAPWLLLTILLGIIPISLIGYDHDFGYHEHWQAYVVCYSLAILTFVLCTTKVRVTWRPLVWLGEISYSIYLLHPLVASAAYRTVFREAVVVVDPLICAALLVLVACLCSWITYRIVEQPFVRLGHLITRRV